MSAEAKTPQWTARDPVEAGILASVNADNKWFPNPEEVANAYFSAVNDYIRCDSPPEPHSSASVVSLLLRTGEKEQVEHGIAMAAEAVEADKQPGLVRQSLEAVQKRNQTIRRNVRKSSTIGNVALVGSAGAGILAVTNDGSFVAISVLTGVFAGFGYTAALVGKMKLMQVEQGTKLLEEHYAHLTLQSSAEPQAQEVQTQDQVEDITIYGELSEVVDAEVDGRRQSVRVYWEEVDERWTRYTSVLEDGTVLHSENSPRYPILTREAGRSEP